MLGVFLLYLENAMNIIEKPISELKAYKNNPKIHTEKQIQQIMKSIELTHGLRQPIVIDADNTVVCGHGRLLAAQRLGMVSVPCELIDDLTEDEIRAYRLIDNEIAKGDTDFDILSEELDKIASVDMSDFDIEIPDSFSIDDLVEIDAYDEDKDEKELFTATFTFPNAQRKQILSYLRQHKAEIVKDIIQKASE